MGYLKQESWTAYQAETKSGNVNLTLKSRNKKTGPIPVSTSGKRTCPNSCPLKASGACYAMSGPLNLFWDKVSENKAGATYERFLDQVRLCLMASCGATIRAAILNRLNPTPKRSTLKSLWL